jgi:hypothetical protein
MIVMFIGQIGSSIIIADILGVLSSLDKRSNATKERALAIQQLLMYAVSGARAVTVRYPWLNAASRVVLFV